MMRNHSNEPEPKPLGDLSLFPREIRDEIYRHIFSKTYMAFYSSSIVKPAFYNKSNDYALSLIERDREERIAADLSVLRVQKAITNEAMLLLYSETTFGFCYASSWYPGSSVLPLDADINIINRMTNIAISCNLGYTLVVDLEPCIAPGWSSIGYSFIPAGPLEFFQGVSITRESILLDLRLYERMIDADNSTRSSFFESPFFEALKQLTGFKNVTLRFRAESYRYFPAQETDEATIQQWLEAQEWEKLYAGLRRLLCGMSNVLEPTLGNRFATELLVSEADDLSWHAQCHTVFHPQAHLAAVSKATNMQSLPVTP